METEEYKGYEVEIVCDEFASNPFEDWDCEPDLIVYSDRRFTSYGKTSADYLPELTREQIRENIDAIKGDYKTLIGYVKCECIYYLSAYCDAVEAINDALQAEYDAKSGRDKLEFLADVYSMAGIVALSGCVTGYSQGDYCDLLAISTPEFIKRTGAKIESPDDLQSTIDLFGYWAFGDVYGFHIESIDNSCFGFYGPDHEKSGLLDMARNAIDCHIEQERKQKQARIKQLIRAHVPLIYRAQDLRA